MDEILVIDTSLKLDKYINNSCKSAYFHIKNIGRIRSCLSDGDTAIFIHAFITNKIVYCDYLLYGMSDNVNSSRNITR